MTSASKAGGLGRILRHLFSMPWSVGRRFPPAALQRIEQAVRSSESTHSGQIRFVVESDLPLLELLRGKSPRQRAIELFSQLRIWDTEHNNGVMIYLLLADHDVEILADRGVHRQVGNAQWQAICRSMEAAFRNNEFERGVLLGLAQVSVLLRQHYPSDGHPGQRANELPDAPVIL